MQIQRKTDLLRHRHHRIQRGGRILEHHAHISSTQIGDRRIGCADDLRAAQLHTALYLRGGGQQPRHGFGDHRFTDAFAVGDVEIDAFDDRLAVDGDAHITNRNAHAASLNAGLANGSSASRRASPNRFSAITTSVTTSPGHSTAIG